MVENNMPVIWFPELGIEIFNLNRVAFSIFGINIYMYAICILAGVLSGLLAAMYLAKKTDIDTDTAYDCFFVLFFSAFLGARLYYVIFQWSYYKNNLLEIFKVQNGGLAIYGGIIGAFLALIIYTKVKKLNFFKFADLCAVGFPIGQAIGRWGNLFNREAYGGYTESLFAMRILKEEAQVLTEDLLNNIIVVNSVEYIQVHPTFLYESVWNLLNFLFLFFYFNKKKFDGEIFAFYLLIYGIGRFFIEGLRQDQLLIWGTSIPVSQMLSLVFVVLAITVIILGRKRVAK